MVETSKGLEVAWCSLVDFHLQVVFDALIMPWGKVKDYKTMYSGISKETYS